MCVIHSEAAKFENYAYKKKCRDLKIWGFSFTSHILRHPPPLIFNESNWVSWMEWTVIYYLSHLMINDFINKTDNKAAILSTVMKDDSSFLLLFSKLWDSLWQLWIHSIFSTDREKWKSILKPISIRIQKLLSQVSQNGPVSGNVVYPFWNETLSEATKMAEDSLSVNYFSPCVNSTPVLSYGRLFHPLVII